MPVVCLEFFLSPETVNTWVLVCDIQLSSWRRTADDRPEASPTASLLPQSFLAYAPSDLDITVTSQGLCHLPYLSALLQDLC